jgi:hypothetical protein
MDNQSLIPDTPLIATEDMVSDQTLQEQIDLDQEKAIAEIIVTPGWKVVEQKLDNYIETFRTGKFMGDTENLALADIGQKFVIANTVASICEDIKSTVYKAAEAVAEHERRQRK